MKIKNNVLFNMINGALNSHLYKGRKISKGKTFQAATEIESQISAYFVEQQKQQLKKENFVVLTKEDYDRYMSIIEKQKQNILNLVEKLNQQNED